MTSLTTQSETPKLAYYRELRSLGYRPSQMREMWEKMQQRLEESSFTITSLVTVVIGIVAFAVISSFETAELWITSPSRNTTELLPFYTAMRIIRKRGWHLTPVEPIRRR